MEEKKRKRYHRGRRKKKERKPGTIISNIILVIAIAVFCFSGFQLFQIYKGYNEGEEEYEQIYNDVISIVTTKETVEDSEEEVEVEKFVVDFDKLNQMNSDVVAWIRFEQPEIINYPVMHGDDNDEYLYRTFHGYDNTVGSIFVNAYNNPDFEDQNTIVYGHRMNNGTMFNKLGEYEEEDFWKRYPYFYIYKEDGTEMKYHIYSVAIVKETSSIYDWQFADDEEFQSFIEETRKNCFYDTGVEVGTDDKVVILSTCTNVREDERLVVIGVREEVVLPE